MTTLDIELGHVANGRDVCIPLLLLGSYFDLKVIDSTSRRNEMIGPSIGSMLFFIANSTCIGLDEML